MSVRDSFNIQSRIAGVLVGALSLTAAFLDVSQANGLHGLGQFLLYGHAMLCTIGGGGLLAISLSGWRNEPMPQTTQHYNTYVQPNYVAAARASKEQLIRQQRHGRLAEGGSALAFSVLATQMPSGSGGEFLAVALAAYGAGSMIGASWNTAHLHWLKYKSSSNAAP